MPRPFPSIRPPCPNPECGALLRKHDRAVSRQRYRCPVCKLLIAPGKSGDWVALSTRVMAGDSIERMAEALKTDETSVRKMLLAWARRAEEMNTRQPPGEGKQRVECAVDGYLVGVGIARRNLFRITDWKTPSGDVLLDKKQSREHAWAKSIIDGGAGDPEEIEARLWVALARSNGRRP